MAQLVEDDQVEPQKALGKLARFVGGFFLLECIDQIDGGEEADLLVVVADRQCQV